MGCQCSIRKSKWLKVVNAVLTQACKWLRAADKVYPFQQEQLRLLIHNLDKSLTTTNDIYSQIIEVWCNCLTFMDEVVSGKSVNAGKPEFYLALSSWHLYPNLAIEGKETSFVYWNDKIAWEEALIPEGTLVTLGIRSLAPRRGNGLTWTMPLSHVQYYGRPKLMSSELSMATSYTTFDRMLAVALGSFISHWGEKAVDLEEVCEFWLALTEVCEHEENRTTKYRNHGDDVPLVWLQTLSKCSKDFLEGTEDYKRDFKRYVDLGRGPLRSFMSETTRINPFFGLQRLNVLLRFFDAEEQVSLLRSLDFYSDLGHDLSLGFIVYRHKTEYGQSGEALVIASVRPCAKLDTGTDEPVHRRWLFTAEELQYDPIRGARIDRLAHQRLLDVSKSTNEICGMVSPHILKTGSGEEVNWKTIHLPNSSLRWLSSQDETNVETSLGISCQIGPPIYENNNHVCIFSTNEAALYVPLTQHANTQFDVLPAAFITAAIRGRISDHEQGLVLELDFERPVDQAFRMLTEKVYPSFTSYLASGIKDTADKASLKGLSDAAQIYGQIPSAMVDLSSARKPLHKSKWLSHDSSRRARVLACLSYFDADIDLEAQVFEDVLALSYGDSLYVIEQLAKFPALRWSDGQVEAPTGTPGGSFDSATHSHVRRLTGNIGKPGLALLRSPQDAESADASDFLSQWQLAAHSDFDGKHEDNFKDVSLHLTLTGDEESIGEVSRGNRIVRATYVEAAVSVIYQGEWVADIDVLDLYERDRDFSLDSEDLAHYQHPPSWLSQRVAQAKCGHDSELSADSGVRNVTAIDNWYALLYPPGNTAVIRAKDNWIARLALACTLKKLGKNAVVLRGHLCWECVRDVVKRLSTKLADAIILL